ncbi:uncharacterized protein BDR25DRAFT_348411 [Lindgomyces ingoldianus]|uniref:Uncharacterized protein n=1 Tax=Lindgomyces ingoldianus TaxID=673940 RepID=A0ACB6RII3_9PLEO|nr:uncharacterized protein BDR25DRAFT_348411 [Lindgomyces ingoldianus]KAF2478132.1 hypothetical protein BDR25DRAFT_348411 [Lindgomyces ingoldianus]
MCVHSQFPSCFKQSVNYFDVFHHVRFPLVVDTRTGVSLVLTGILLASPNLILPLYLHCAINIVTYSSLSGATGGVLDAARSLMQRTRRRGMPNEDFDSSLLFTAQNATGTSGFGTFPVYVYDQIVLEWTDSKAGFEAQAIQYECGISKRRRAIIHRSNTSHNNTLITLVIGKELFIYSFTFYLFEFSSHRHIVINKAIQHRAYTLFDIACKSVFNFGTPLGELGAISVGGFGHNLEEKTVSKTWSCVIWKMSHHHRMKRQHDERMLKNDQQHLDFGSARVDTERLFVEIFPLFNEDFRCMKRHSRRVYSTGHDPKSKDRVGEFSSVPFHISRNSVIYSAISWRSK